ncbi:MAG: hypothetical protein H6742_11490 [Alphaproteobacteria bacterium]|nr:hypothetical protein [Alphaproteobacteria bacterium]
MHLVALLSIGTAVAAPKAPTPTATAAETIELPGADVTAMPSRLRGTAALGWDGSGDIARLEEAGTIVGRRHAMRHDLSLDLAFAPLPGVAVAIELPMVLSQTVRWNDAQAMAFDPTGSEGSFLGGETLAEPPRWTGSGFGQTLFAVRLAPFHIHRLGVRPDRTSWVLEVGYRMQDKSSFWQQQAGTAENPDKRGGGDGADALHVRSAWSTVRDSSRPYLEATFDRSFTVPTALWDEDGAVTGTVEVRPPSRFQLRAGAEVPAKRTEDMELAVDLGIDAGYRSWSDVVSGVYLPDVLAASRSVLVTQDDALWLDGRVGMQIRALDKVDVMLGGRFGTETPYQVEHPYTAHTAFGTLRWGGEARVRVWLHEPLWDKGEASAASAPAPELAPAPVITPLPPTP